MPKKPSKKQSDRGESIESLKAEIAELKTGWQRTQADFANFRRRIDEQRSDVVDRIAADTLLEFAPAYDNLQRALAHIGNDHASWADGFQHIAKQIESVFAEHGLERIESVSTVFDPTKHEAVSQLPHPTHPEDTIIEELESGWQRNGQVIKAAKVVVSTGQEKTKSKTQRTNEV